MRLVGDEASSQERVMVQNPVVVPTAAGVHGHLRRLAVAFDWSSVSLNGPQKEVGGRSEWDSRGVVHVVDAVEVWLERCMGDHCYTAVGPVRVTSTR